MSKIQSLEVPISGMDCADCARHVRRAIGSLPGVRSVEVLLNSEKAVIECDGGPVRLPEIRRAVEQAGYSVPDSASQAASSSGLFTRRIFTFLATVFGAVLFIVVVGEWLGLFAALTERVPFSIGLALVAASGWPVFAKVVRSTLKRQITAHTLMTVGALAALLIGQWATAAVVVFFMRVGDYAESFTTESARRAVKDLTAMAPRKARVERDGVEREVAAAEVHVGEIVIVRPGEAIPVDGEVTAGQATVDQAAITGESMPVEVAPGSHVFAATMAQLGGLRVRTTRTGPDTTFGRVITMVENAEAQRGSVQRLADRFSTYYLPVVAGVAAVTFLLSRNPLSTVAVLVVACSCSIALATPIAVLSSIGAGAKRGLLIKGGKYLESLNRADVLLIDKTGTLTLGRPRVTDVVPVSVLEAGEVLELAASAERYSEHPLAEAVRRAARDENLAPAEPEDFQAVPGLGVRARVGQYVIAVGNRRLFPGMPSPPRAIKLETQGKTVLFVVRNQELVGLLAAADEVRPEVPWALAQVRQLGLRRVELLTGDNERTAAAVAAKLEVPYRANLLPEDKISIVRDYQTRGHTVVMVGDGVNDAPALAQADIGVAMGAAGADVAIEAAHIALMREDWNLVPDLFVMARRTMGVVKVNLAFTALYNGLGLSLAALGFLPPVLAAAAQSLPDLGILANSVRLLRVRTAGTERPAGPERTSRESESGLRSSE